MTQDITIAVVIPSYNSSSTIANCINSVINQSEQVDELIIVDDGSSDNSAIIISEMFNNISTDFKKVLIKQSNKGPSAARNRGVSNAMSTHISFLDSDDQWHPDHIKLIKGFLKYNNEYDLIADKYQSAPFRYSGEITLKNTLFRNYFITPCVLIRKQTFFENNGFQENMRFAEDYYLWLNVLYTGKGYLLPGLGARSIENKRPFGEKGLSSNLRQMHLGVLQSLRSLWHDKKISYYMLLMAIFVENIKYLRRLLLSNSIEN